MIDTAVTSQKNSSFTQKTDTPIDWPLIWARKFRKDLHTRGKIGMGYTSIIRAFTSTLYYHPKNATSEAVLSFNNHSPEERQEQYRKALSLFYTLTVPNDTLNNTIIHYQQVHRNKSPIAQQHHLMPGTERNLLDQLKKEMLVRNYSRKTVRNYSDNVASYLHYIQQSPGMEDNATIRNYMIFLRDESGYSPRTVNLHCAALMFFYEHIIGITDIPALKIRMKTGKQLPKVYSKEEIDRPAVHSGIAWA